MAAQMADPPPEGGGEEEEMVTENGAHDLGDEEEKGRRKGHMKTSSISERERKIGHRRVNEAGQVSYKKVETNALMGSIQLGIHDSVGGLAKYPERDLLMQDFMSVETSQFPSKGGHQTPGHPYSDFTFRTYAPVAFRYFRDLFGIPPDDFMISICNENLRELSNPGASGSIFYLTRDDEFILKTVSMKEAEFLQKLMPGYYMNLQQNPRTLLPKFFGMFTYQANQKNIRLVVMNNLLPSGVKMHLKFDLKGSTYKRKASKHEKEKKSPTFKDLDYLELLPEGLLLEPETYTALISTMRRDCRVLESFKIMDYSLLLGIHNLDRAAREREEEEKSAISNNEKAKSVSQQKAKLVAHSTAMESIQATSDPVDIPHELQGGMPARNHKGERILIFVGIIDILQSYRLSKKLEHTFKAIIHDGDTVSVHRPDFYAKRFMNFMSTKIFKKIPSLDLPEVKGSHRKFRTVVASLIGMKGAQRLPLPSEALKHSPSKKTKALKVKGGQVSGQSSGSGTSPPEKISQLGTEDSLATAASCSLASMTSPPSSEDTAANSNSLLSPPLAELEAPPSCILPAVLRDRPGGRKGAPPPIPPRSPRRPGSAPRGPFPSATPRPDVVPDSWSTHQPQIDASLPDVRLEPRAFDSSHSRSTLDTPSKLSMRGTPTPTWTEGTPSYTDSTYSGDALPDTPARSLDLDFSGAGIVGSSQVDAGVEKLDPLDDKEPYHETEM